MAEWRSATVADLQRDRVLLVEDGNHGEYRPRPDEFTDNGVAFIRAADLDAGRIDFKLASKINERARQRITKGIGAPGDVILSHKGTVGKVALAPDDAPPFVCSPQTTFWRTCDEGQLDRKFLYVFLRSPNFHAQLATRAGETDMAPYVSLTSQRGLSVTIPPIGTQKNIASTIGALDDKIELNHRMKETLEAMARAIFKDWFVEFGPTRAKTEGRAPYLAPEIWALFPDRLDHAGIPEGWVLKPLVELTSKIGSGATPTGGSQVYVPSGTALIRSQNVHDHEFVWDGLARITDSAADKLNGVTVCEGDVLINITGDSILRCCMVDQAVLPARVNQHVSIIRAKPRMSRHFIHQYLVLTRSKELLLGFDAGGSRPAVTKAHLERFPVLFPGEQALTAFDEAISALSSCEEANSGESRTLANLRDLLIPKLISGEIRAKEAAKVAEAVL